MGWGTALLAIVVVVVMWFIVGWRKRANAVQAEIQSAADQLTSCLLNLLEFDGQSPESLQRVAEAFQPYAIAMSRFIHAAMLLEKTRVRCHEESQKTGSLTFGNNVAFEAARANAVEKAQALLKEGPVWRSLSDKLLRDVLSDRRGLTEATFLAHQEKCGELERNAETILETFQTKPSGLSVG